MKHLTYDDRLQIQKGLTLNKAFSEISAMIGKNRSTIGREVKAYSKYVGKPARSKCKHTCIFEDKSKCPVPICTKNSCSVVCSKCAIHCERYEPDVCKKLTRPPYVCNGCSDRGTCSFMKKIYDAGSAQKEYKRILTETREGVSLSDEEINTIANTIIPLIKNGISLPSAYSAYANVMVVSERTIYDYIDKGLFDIHNIDLRRKVRRKPSRKKSGPNLHIDKHCHVGRTYADFSEYVADNPGINVCEMDTVEGRKGGKVLLTIFFRNCDLQLMFLRDANTAASVGSVFSMLRYAFQDDFKCIFPLILTDRGTEFTNPDEIEVNMGSGKREIRLFYCDPQQTNQKSRCERNHEYIRYIFPKGTSFDGFSQQDIDLVMNHVNSMPRGSLNAKAPIQIFIEIYGAETARRLNLEFIPIQQLCLKPKLLKK